MVNNIKVKSLELTKTKFYIFLKEIIGCDRNQCPRGPFLFCDPVQMNKILLLWMPQVRQWLCLFLLGAETHDRVTHFFAATLLICKKPILRLRRLVLLLQLQVSL